MLDSTWPATPGGVSRKRRRVASPRNRGQLHAKAVLSDRMVDLMRQLRDEDPKRWTYRTLGAKFEVHWTTAMSICRGRTR